jgi:hypothetical protein
MGTTIIVPANAPHYAAAKDGETIVRKSALRRVRQGLAKDGGKVAF